MQTALPLLRRAWQLDRPLTGTSLLMLALLPLAGAGLVFDDRLIAGAPAWLKPAKFMVSTALYGLTLVWVLSWLESWPRLRRIVSQLTAAVFVIEVAIICLQAWRGTTSHFNVSTVLDGLLFSIMGAAIAAQTIASGAVAVALFRQRIDDPMMAAALRSAMVITLLGASTGGLMTSPSKAQIQDAVEHGRMTVSGSHTVGAADGGPGIPGTGWSREHGDLRVPHFVGLHAMQALPLLGLWLRRRGVSDPRRLRVAAASYAAFFGVLLLQALRGEPVLAPGAVVSSLLAAWAIATLAGWGSATRASWSGSRAAHRAGGLA